MLTPGARRLAREQNANRPPTPQGAPASWVETGVIASVTADAGADGHDLAAVTYRGATQYAAYLDSYTPVVGHVVLLAVTTQGSLIIFDRIRGTPPV